jgi:sugar (pentulose or hexulose) kinase
MGSEGARFLPYLRQQSDNPGEAEPSGGMVLGLRETHGLGHLARAVLEGLSFETYRMFQEINKTIGSHTPPIRAVGGSTRNRLWMQTKAEFMQTPIETYRSPHAAAWGAAWLAGHHLGLVESLSLQVQARFDPKESAQNLLQSYQQALQSQLDTERQTLNAKRNG